MQNSLQCHVDNLTGIDSTLTPENFHESEVLNAAAGDANSNDEDGAGGVSFNMADADDDEINATIKIPRKKFSVSGGVVRDSTTGEPRRGTQVSLIDEDGIDMDELGSSSKSSGTATSGKDDDLGESQDLSLSKGTSSSLSGSALTNSGSKAEDEEEEDDEDEDLDDSTKKVTV